VRVVAVSVLATCLLFIYASAAASPIPDDAPDADDPPASAEARRKLEEGNLALSLARYDDAVVAYEAGAHLDPAPIFFYNLGLAHWYAGRDREALRALRTFLERTGETPQNAAVRGRAKQNIEELQRGLERSSTPMPTPLAPTPPVNVTVQQAVDVRQATTVTSSSRDRGFGGWRATGAAALGGSAALGSVATWLLVSAASRDNNANRESDRARQRDLRESADGRRAWGTALTLGAGAAAMSGAALLLWPTGERLAVEPGPGDVGLGARVRF
jgi:tetratricopeptide (TPR) repeat protein